MNWTTLINEERLHPYENFIKYRNPKKVIDIDNYPFEFDNILASTCSATRAMQSKTQVFAFGNTNFSRTRLTHSVEVALTASQIISSIKRYVDNSIKNPPRYKNKDTTKRLNKIRREFCRRNNEISSIVSTAGLLHDIGNPPFGHIGEDILKTTISDWFTSKSFSEYQIKEQEKEDLIEIEGNAQGLRYLIEDNSIRELSAINPTLSVLSCLMKYTVANTSQIDPNGPIYLHKKGFYLSEEEPISSILEKLKIPVRKPGNARNPLAFILEAADDISYRTSDFEDSYLKGLINLDDIKSQLEKYNEKKDWACHDCFNKFLEDIKTVNTPSDTPSDTPSEKSSIVYSWVTQLKIQLIYSATWSFVKNYNEIMKGKFTIELLKDPDCFNKSTLEVLENLMKEKVYNSDEIKNQNVQAEKILETIWSHLTEFIRYGTIEDIKDKDEPFNQLPPHLQETLRKLKDRIKEKHVYQRNSFLYDELRLIIDFICFLSDDDAKHLAGYYAGSYNSSDYKSLQSFGIMLDN